MEAVDQALRLVHYDCLFFVLLYSYSAGYHCFWMSLRHGPFSTSVFIASGWAYDQLWRYMLPSDWLPPKLFDVQCFDIFYFTCKNKENLFCLTTVLRTFYFYVSQVQVNEQEKLIVTLMFHRNKTYNCVVLAILFSWTNFYRYMQ